MTFKKDDKFEMDGDSYEVLDVDFLGYWTKRTEPTPSGIIHQSVVYLNKDEVDAAWMRGKVKQLNRKDPSGCWHNWVRYTGAREIYNFCDKCDAKQEIDWKELK